MDGSSWIFVPSRLCPPLISFLTTSVSIAFSSLIEASQKGVQYHIPRRMYKPCSSETVIWAYRLEVEKEGLLAHTLSTRIAFWQVLKLENRDLSSSQELPQVFKQESSGFAVTPFVWNLYSSGCLILHLLLGQNWVVPPNFAFHLNCVLLWFPS